MTILVVSDKIIWNMRWFWQLTQKIQNIYPDLFCVFDVHDTINMLVDAKGVVLRYLFKLWFLCH